jgi:hypothetical protein
LFFLLLHCLALSPFAFASESLKNEGKAERDIERAAEFLHPPSSSHSQPQQFSHQIQIYHFIHSPLSPKQQSNPVSSSSKVKKPAQLGSPSSSSSVVSHAGPLFTSIIGCQCALFSSSAALLFLFPTVLISGPAAPRHMARSAAAQCPGTCCS